MCECINACVYIAGYGKLSEDGANDSGFIYNSQHLGLAVPSVQMGSAH